MRSAKLDTTVIGSPLPPLLTALTSLILPGLGQILSRQIQRGLLMFASLASMFGIFLTRLASIASDYNVEGAGRILGKSFQHYPGFSALILFSLALLYLWIILDAYRLAKYRKKQKNTGFWLVLLGFFTLGHQLSEIDMVRLVTNFPEASQKMSKILWPWEAAVEYDEELIQASARILVSEEGELPEDSTGASGEPDISIEPRRGSLGTVDENYNQLPGSRVTIRGSGFTPDTFTEIWWIDDTGEEFRPRSEGSYVGAVTDGRGNFEITMNLPFANTIIGADGAEYHRIDARQVFQVGAPKFSRDLGMILSRMLETIFMGMMATVFGIIFSIPISFLAARNIMQGSKLTMTIYYVTRILLNIIRSIEPLIWAIIAVVWVGLGPFAGIIALTIHSIAALGKLYSEAIEGIDHGPIEAIQATGATRLQTIVFAVIPQMISPFVSFSIYRWDINVRMSTIIGLVGGGGIGFLLVQYTRLLEYELAGIAVWFIAITVAILDYVSAEIRARFM